LKRKGWERRTEFPVSIFRIIPSRGEEVRSCAIAYWMPGGRREKTSSLSREEGKRRGGGYALSDCSIDFQVVPRRKKKKKRKEKYDR